MIARSGNMQTAPMSAGEGHPPLRAMPATACELSTAPVAYNGGFRHRQERDIVTYGHPRTQGSDRPAARAARGLSVLQRGRATRSTSARRARCATASATIWAPTASDAKTDALLDEIARLEVIVTDSVVEALALENNLIKQRTPKYNILLRDDKNYPYLQLTTNEAFPRVLVARRVERDGSFYAGPFLPAHFARKTMSLTHRLFGIRSCNEVITGKRERPCLEYDIKRCIAPCVDTICSRGGVRARGRT